jgi:hypothetical protein
MAKLNILLTDTSKYNNFDTDLNSSMKEYIESLIRERYSNWSNYKTFWPPRLIKALKDNTLSCFFGAGLSIPCGLPSWDSLLRDNLGVSKDFLDDDNAKNDPLTQAELAAHKIGTEKVQELIRASVSKTNKPSYNHYLLVNFKLKYYITGNYDCLFEKAWNDVNGNGSLKVILNDSDLYTYFEDGNIDMPKNSGWHYLFKVHGCADKKNEQLILTRSDYRRHYRSNQKFFETLVEKIFTTNHMLFLGFSHKDPEISRLVEDSIWSWEKDKDHKLQPNFYSLQFDMTSITPEIFAARGIVALNPPILIPKESKIDMRSYCLAHALVDLHAMQNYINIEDVSLEKEIDVFYDKINHELSDALIKLKKYKNKSDDCLTNKSYDFSWLSNLIKDLGVFAGQGVYLLNDEGEIVHYEIEDRLKITRETRIKKLGSFDDRPYFQQARTFREEFISDLYESVFNKIATFSICLPIISDNIFKGLLFSACQIGQWQTPVELAKNIQNQRKSVILVDSNGVCLFPPNKEFEYETTDIDSENRIGFLYDDLLVLSRRDKLVNRVMENLIPLGKDDDVLSLSNDLKYYSLVKEFLIARWKLTLSSRVILSKK